MRRLSFETWKKQKNLIYRKLLKEEEEKKQQELKKKMQEIEYNRVFWEASKLLFTIFEFNTI